MIFAVILSYLLSLTFRAFFSKAYISLLIILFLMLFYTPFYNIFLVIDDLIYGRAENNAIKIVVFLFSLLPKIFIIFHSSVFALVVALGIEPFSKGTIIMYFYIGFILNALNLEFICLFMGKTSFFDKNKKLSPAQKELNDLIRKYK